jgi:methionine aminopeptidase
MNNRVITITDPTPTKLENGMAMTVDTFVLDENKIGMKPKSIKIYFIKGGETIKIYPPEKIRKTKTRKFKTLREQAEYIKSLSQK